MRLGKALGCQCKRNRSLAQPTADSCMTPPHESRATRATRPERRTERSETSILCDLWLVRIASLFVSKICPPPVSEKERTLIRADSRRANSKKDIHLYSSRASLKKTSTKYKCAMLLKKMVKNDMKNRVFFVHRHVIAESIAASDIVTYLHHAPPLSDSMGESSTSQIS